MASRPLSQLSKASAGRLQGLPKALRSLATKVERKELSLGSFLCTVVRLVGNPERGPDDVRLADWAVLYLRRRPNISRECVEGIIETFEAHSKVVYMHRNRGYFKPWMGIPGKQGVVPDHDETKLRKEVCAKLGHFDDERAGSASGPTLFDKSTKSQTMQASKYAI